jgi:hypothetical protein
MGRRRTGAGARAAPQGRLMVARGVPLWLLPAAAAAAVLLLAAGGTLRVRRRTRRGRAESALGGASHPPPGPLAGSGPST